MIGNSFFMKKEYSKAIEFYEQALKIKPDSPLCSILVSNKSACLNQMEKYEENLSFIDSYLPNDPHYIKLIFRKIQALESLGKVVPAYHRKTFFFFFFVIYYLFIFFFFFFDFV